MYFYSVENCEYETNLAHNQKFTKEEFYSMCESCKKNKYGNYSVSRIVEHLINNYGFEEIEAMFHFNVDDYNE